MAMYTQLSEELETTNRGVVALYAELDEKSQRLQETTEAKSRFLNNVSHELRSPVSSIVGLSRLLLEPDERLPAGRATAAGRAGGGHGRGAARPRQPAARPGPRRVRAPRAGGEPGRARRARRPVSSTCCGRWPATAWSVAVTATEGHVDVFTDPTLVRQVVRNLVANALAFTTAGSVTVRIDRPAPDAVARGGRSTPGSASLPPTSPRSSRSSSRCAARTRRRAGAAGSVSPTRAGWSSCSVAS